MSTKGKRPGRTVTASHKMEAVKRVNDGESKASVARDIGVPESTLRGWCKNENKLRFMSRMSSSPDTDSGDEPPGKRSRTESPAAPRTPPAAGLDLSAPPPAPGHAAHSARHTPPAAPPAAPDAPVELTTKRPPVTPAAHAARDAGASASMSAISPQRPSLIPTSGLPILPSSYANLGTSYNDIAANLSLLAQLNNPISSSLSAQSGSRTLRSVRSPKPAHSAVPGTGDTKHRSKSHHSADHYRFGGTPSATHLGASTAANASMDETLWYWQTLMNLSTQATAATHHPLHLGKSTETSPISQPVALTAPINSLDYNRNSWLWQYYKQIGGAVTLPDEKIKSAAQVPKGSTIENILYSHLTKTKPVEKTVKVATTSPVRPQSNEPVRESAPISPVQPRPSESNKEPAASGPSRTPEPAASPSEEPENKEPATVKIPEPARNQDKVRMALDSVLYKNSAIPGREASAAKGERRDASSIDALEHGEKFLTWLESCGDPSVTLLHVHQLGSLLQNLRARRGLPAHPPHPAHTAHVAPTAHIAPTASGHVACGD